MVGNTKSQKRNETMHETVTPALFAITASRGRWQTAPHLLILSDKLTQVAAGDLKRLMVFMPPRSGKSQLISQFFPAWYLGHHPDNRIILTSYEADFAATWGWKARSVFEEFAPDIFGLSMRGDSSARNRWDITDHVGGMNTAGVGGAITGKGANCLIGSTPIITSDGTKTIESITQMRNMPHILAYNHTTSRLEWCRIIATKASTKPILEIETVRGRKIRTTREHRVFVDQQGYTEAYRLCEGDRVYVATIAEKPDMPTLREREERKGRPMSSVLPKAPGSPSADAMFSVWGSLRDACIRVLKSIETWANRFLLLEGMLSKTPCRKECEIMRSMWQADARKKRKQVLLKRMPKDRAGCTKTNSNMPGMRGDIPSTVPSNSILHPELCERCPFKTHDGGWKFTLQRWDELFKTFFRNETPDSGKGSVQMCDMRGEPCLKNPSYRRRCDEQCSNESDNNVSVPPHNSSQIEYDTISGVREVSGGAVSVYDLQVEGCNNFFAGEILVHNCFIIDDPVKNAEDANSQLKRDKAWDWYQSTAYTRLEPDAAMILIMTRWHPEDLGGLLLKEMEAGGEQWDVLKFPAIAEENDLMGRKIGEPLWKERYPLESLNTIQGTVSAYWWAAMYQQSPYARTGKTFKRADFIMADGGAQGSQVRFWDLAATEETKGKDPDWTVGCLMSEHRGRFWIKDIIRVREDAAEVERIIAQAALMDGKETRIFMEQEGGASGKSLISYYARTVLKGYSFEGIPSTGSKPLRAQPLAAAVANGNVHLIAAGWNSVFLDEAEQFPNGAHDDQVDAAAQSFNMLFDDKPDPGRFRVAGAKRE